MRSTYRPSLNRVLAGAVIAVCVLGLAWSLVSDGAGTLWTVGPWAAAIALAVWAVYWQPRVVVGDDEVALVNVLRTVVLPWSAVTAIDTKWTLTFRTAGHRYAAWASPGPGGVAKARAAARLRRQERSPFASPGPIGGATPTPAPRITVAEAALRQWEQTRDTPTANDGRAVSVAWHWPVIVGVPVLVVLAIIVAWA